MAAQDVAPPVSATSVESQYTLGRQLKHLRGFDHEPIEYERLTLEEVAEFLNDLNRADVAGSTTGDKWVKVPHAHTHQPGHADSLKLDYRRRDPQDDQGRTLYLTDVAQLLQEAYAFVTVRYYGSHPKVINALISQNVFNVPALTYARTPEGWYSEETLASSTRRQDLQVRIQALSATVQILLGEAHAEIFASLREAIERLINTTSPASLWIDVISPLAQAFRTTPRGYHFVKVERPIGGLTPDNYAITEFPEIFDLFTKAVARSADTTEWQARLANKADDNGTPFLAKLADPERETFYFKTHVPPDVTAKVDAHQTVIEEFIRFFDALFKALSNMVPATPPPDEAPTPVGTDGGDTEALEAPVQLLTVEEVRELLKADALARLLTLPEVQPIVEEYVQEKNLTPEQFTQLLLQVLQDHFDFPRDNEIEAVIRATTNLIDRETQRVLTTVFAGVRTQLLAQAFANFLRQIPTGATQRVTFINAILAQIDALLGGTIPAEEAPTPPVEPTPEAEAPATPAETIPTAAEANELATQPIVPNAELLDQLKQRYRNDQYLQRLTPEEWATQFGDRRADWLARERVRLVALLRNDFFREYDINPKDFSPEQIENFHLIVEYYVSQRIDQLSPQDQLQLLNVGFLRRFARDLAFDPAFRNESNIFFETQIRTAAATQKSPLAGEELRKRARGMLILYGDQASEVADKLKEDKKLTETLFGYQFAKELEAQERDKFDRLAEQYIEHLKYEIAVRSGKPLADTVTPLTPLTAQDIEALSNEQYRLSQLGLMESASGFSEEYFFRDEAFKLSQQLQQQLPEDAYRYGFGPRGLNRFNPFRKKSTDVAKDLITNSIRGGVGTAAGALNPVLGALFQLDTLRRLAQDRRMRELLAALMATSMFMVANTIRLFLSSWGGFFGGLIGGFAGGTLLGFAGPLGIGAGGLGGWMAGTHAGNALFGKNLPLIGGPSPAELFNLNMPGLGSKAVTATKVPFWTNTGIAAPTTAIALTAGMSILTNTAIRVAFLEPINLAGTDEDISRFVTLDKTASPSSSDNPTTVIYTITVQAKDQYRVRITGAEDSMRVKYNPDTRGSNPGPSQAPPINPPNAITSLIGQEIGPEAPVQIQYEVPFGQEFDDAAISNTFRLTFDVIAGPELPTGQIAAVTSRVCFGECPTAECIEILDSGSVARGSRPWPADQRDKVEQTIDNLLSYPYFFDLLCAGGQPVKLFKVSGGLDGWGIFYHRTEFDEIYFNDGPFVSSGGENALNYIFAHEFGHVIDYRNSRMAQRFAEEAPWSGSMFTYPLATDDKLQEAFAEAVALYFTSDSYPVPIFDFPGRHRDEYNWIGEHVYGTDTSD